MTIHQHISTFHGLPVAAFDEPQPPSGPVAWRVATDAYEPEEPFAQTWQRFLTTVDTTSVTALVIGPWGEVYDEDHSDAVIEQLVAAKGELPALNAVFLGDIVMEEAEISWIQQGDITPLLREFPALTELVVRGGTGLQLEPLRHNALQSLTLQTGGLPGAVVRAVGDCDLPALRDLRLWLGVEEYGGDYAAADFAAILGGQRLGALRYLGLQNSIDQNDIARWAAESAIVGQLETLDLSMGALSNEGAGPLFGLTHLKTLDLRHHFLSEDMAGKLRAVLQPAGVRVILDDVKTRYKSSYDNEEYYYTAVSE